MNAALGRRASLLALVACLGVVSSFSAAGAAEPTASVDATSPDAGAVEQPDYFVLQAEKGSLVKDGDDLELTIQGVGDRAGSSRTIPRPSRTTRPRTA